jgi:hypothetical protein
LRVARRLDWTRGLFSHSAYRENQRFESNLPSGAKAHIHFGEFMYGLKSVPFTH